MQKVKKELRSRLISRRRELDIAEKAMMDEDIFLRVRPMLDKADVVLTYASTDIEVDTWRIIEYCLQQGIRVATPVSGDSELYFYEIKSLDELSDGRFGIKEPINRTAEVITTENSLCIVPALCADGNGFRLGYGRGYYDRFLAGFSGKSVILCYSTFRGEVPTEPHDRAADYTIFDSLAD